MTKTEAHKKTIPTKLIAPCGLNCRLCYAYIREKNPCPGCRGDDNLKPQYCVTCKIKNCEQLKGQKPEYCFNCEAFPCAKLKQLDKRYRTKYATSITDNLNMIKGSGIRYFIRNEKQKRACRHCGTLVCVHKPECPSCGQAWHKE